jgi:hypothetical protein
MVGGASRGQGNLWATSSELVSTQHHDPVPVPGGPTQVRRVCVCVFVCGVCACMCEYVWAFVRVCVCLCV